MKNLISLSAEEMDSVFWDAAAPGVPTEGIGEFLTFLKENKIRTGVISNISYSGIVSCVVYWGNRYEVWSKGRCYYNKDMERADRII